MASLGHIAVGIAAARVSGRPRISRRPRIAAVVLWSLLSLLPDADVIGFPLGVRYEDEWGHRGATHSLVFSLAGGAAVGLAAPLFHLPRLRTGVTAAAVLVSHALLDTLTDGGLGCALFWPFDQTRYFAPWRPIPVAPIGLAYFSPYGLMVAATELMLFAPLLWLALARPATTRRPAVRRWGLAMLLGAWAGGAWVFSSRGPARDRIVGAIVREDTQYASGFSEEGLRAIAPGQSMQQVRDRLGEPFYRILAYADRPGACGLVYLDGERVTWARPADSCRAAGLEPGASEADALRRLGTPSGRCWLYTRSTARRYYRARAVCFEDGRVVNIIQQWFRD